MALAAKLAEIAPGDLGKVLLAPSGSDAIEIARAALYLASDDSNYVNGAILAVDGMKAPVPAAAFGTGENGATLNATKAQIVGMLQAAQQEAMAKRDAALVVGAEAVTAKNAPLGTVLEIEGDNVIIARGGDEANKITAVGHVLK